MKKILLLVLTISFFSMSSYAQAKWTEVFNNETIKIEYKTEDCNPNNKAIPNTYAIMKYTNLTNNQIDFSYEINLWYNDVLHSRSSKDTSAETFLKELHLEGNEIIEGDCTNHSEMFYFLYKHNHPKMDINLTKISIIEK